MSPTSECHEPGLLLVFTRPKSHTYLKEFHEWYNTEHGPSRMKLDFVDSGRRYKCKDDGSVWAALYDLDRVSGTVESQYTNLRKHRSAREHDVMTRMVDVLDRKIYKHISTRGTSQGPAPVMTCVSFVVRHEDVDEIDRWYEQEHIGDLSRIPGWRRSRRFVVVDGSVSPGCVELLALHDFDQENGLGGPEHMRARHRPWREKIVQLAKSRQNREFEFYREFRAEEYMAPPEHMKRPEASLNTRRPSLVTSHPSFGERSLVDLSRGQSLITSQVY